MRSVLLKNVLMIGFSGKNGDQNKCRLYRRTCSSKRPKVLINIVTDVSTPPLALTSTSTRTILTRTCWGQRWLSVCYFKLSRYYLISHTDTYWPHNKERAKGASIFAHESFPLSYFLLSQWHENVAIEVALRMYTFRVTDLKGGFYP